VTTSVRDHTTGRFRPIRRDWPTCEHCGSIKFERLSGELACVMAWCRGGKR
jgi:hypothetical protein